MDTLFPDMQTESSVLSSSVGRSLAFFGLGVVYSALLLGLVLLGILFFLTGGDPMALFALITQATFAIFVYMAVPFLVLNVILYLCVRKHVALRKGVKWGSLLLMVIFIRSHQVDTDVSAQLASQETSWQAITNNDPAGCEQVPEQFERDFCYFQIAMHDKDVSLCEKINGTEVDSIATKRECVALLAPTVTPSPTSQAAPGAASSLPQITPIITDAVAETVRLDVNQLKVLADIYHTANNNSYVGFEKCVANPTSATCKGGIESSVVALKEDMKTATGIGAGLISYTLSDQFCIAQQVSSTKSVCADKEATFTGAVCHVAPTQVICN